MLQASLLQQFEGSPYFRFQQFSCSQGYSNACVILALHAGRHRACGGSWDAASLSALLNEGLELYEENCSSTALMLDPEEAAHFVTGVRRLETIWARPAPQSCYSD